jgi:hypothetical protein
MVPLIRTWRFAKRLFSRLLRNCPKSLERIAGVLPRWAKCYLFGLLRLHTPAKFTIETLLKPLFGQFL